MRELLFLAHRIPYPPNKGDKLRSYNLLKVLSARCSVHLGCFVDDPDDWKYVDEVRKCCAQAHFAPLNPARARMRALTSLARGEPLTFGYYRDAGLSRWVHALAAQRRMKYVLAFSAAMAQYCEAFPHAVRVMDMVDVDSAKWGELARTMRWPRSWLYRREARTLLHAESCIAKSFDATVFVSRAEAGLFCKLSGLHDRRVTHAGNGVDANYFAPGNELPNPYPNGARYLVFTGAMDYWPNVDAVQWFVREIFPAIRARWPGTGFAIVGARPTEDVLKLGDAEGVMVTGTVPDVRPYLEHAVAVVAPLRIARGIQNKVLEGMAMAKTVIASPAAAEGIEFDAGRELLIAESPADYIHHLHRIFEGSLHLGHAARARILSEYSWERNLERVFSLLFNEGGAGERATIA